MNKQKIKTINNIKQIINLEKDINLFSKKERKQMSKFIDELIEEEDKENNDIITLNNEDDFDEFFVDNVYEEFKKLEGKCFINETLGEAVKIIEIPNDEYDNIEPYEFIFEKFYKTQLGEWYAEDYIWLQEQDEVKFNKYKLTEFADMNIASEGMMHLGKDGMIYINVSCGDEFYQLHQITEQQFNKIRKQAIKNKD